jgi:hypothetical protein
MDLAENVLDFAFQDVEMVSSTLMSLSLLAILSLVDIQYASLGVVLPKVGYRSHALEFSFNP